MPHIYYHIDFTYHSYVFLRLRKSNVVGPKIPRKGVSGRLVPAPWLTHFEKPTNPKAASCTSHMQSCSNLGEESPRALPLSPFHSQLESASSIHQSITIRSFVTPDLLQHLAVWKPECNSKYLYRNSEQLYLITASRISSARTNNGISTTESFASSHCYRAWSYCFGAYGMRSFCSHPLLYTPYPNMLSNPAPPSDSDS